MIIQITYYKVYEKELFYFLIVNKLFIYILNSKRCMDYSYI